MKFKLKSGNSPLFKLMGSSSPLRITGEEDEAGLVTYLQSVEDKTKEADELIKRVQESLKNQEPRKTTIDERQGSGTMTSKDKQVAQASWLKRQKDLNTMAWNRGGTGNWMKDRWSGSRIRDLRFSLKDAIMGGDIKSGFSTKARGGVRGRRGNRSNRGGSYWPGGDLFGPTPYSSTKDTRGGGGWFRNLFKRKPKKITREDMTQCTIGNNSPECSMW